MKGKAEKRVVPSGARVLFGLLAVGFTLISAWNGLDFYKVLFGMSMSVLIVSVFEIARLACLFRFIRARRNAEFLSIIIYTIVASVCAFAAINSFTSKVIRKNLQEEEEMQKQIHRIKQEYSKRTDEKLITVNRDITYLENMISKYPNSDYWRRRLSQYQANRDSLIKSRDNFLNTNPEDPEQWIKSNSAKLGMKLENMSENTEEIRSVVLALRELWKINKITAQKIMGIIVTVTVELSILLLAFLSAGRNYDVTEKIEKSHVRRKSQKSNHTVKEKDRGKFISISRDYFKKTGKLPPMRKLSPNLRPVKREFEKMDEESLKLLFEEEKEESVIRENNRKRRGKE